MDNGIFNDNELEKLKKPNLEFQNVDSFLAEEDRISGLEEAVEKVKTDYKTHDVLFERFQEPIGFVLKISNGLYLKDGKTYSDSEKGGYFLPYFSIRFPNLTGYQNFGILCNAYLLIRKDRQNALILGKNFEECRIDENSVQSELTLFVSNSENFSAKDSFDVSLLNEVVRKVFLERACLENAVRTPGDFDANRKFFRYKSSGSTEPDSRITDLASESEFKEGISTSYHLLTDFTGDDFILFYKHAVKGAVKEHEKLENITSKDIVSSDNPWRYNCYRLFSKDYSQSKKVITKLYGFNYEPIDISFIE